MRFRERKRERDGEKRKGEEGKEKGEESDRVSGQSVLDR